MANKTKKTNDKIVVSTVSPNQSVTAKPKVKGSFNEITDVCTSSGLVISVKTTTI